MAENSIPHVDPTEYTPQELREKAIEYLNGTFNCAEDAFMLIVTRNIRNFVAREQAGGNVEDITQFLIGEVNPGSTILFMRHMTRYIASLMGITVEEFLIRNIAVPLLLDNSGTEDIIGDLVDTSGSIN